MFVKASSAAPSRRSVPLVHTLNTFRTRSSGQDPSYGLLPQGNAIAGHDRMSLERNKLIYRNFIEEVFNKGRLDLLEVFLDPSYVFHDAPAGIPSGINGVWQIVTMF